MGRQQGNDLQLLFFDWTFQQQSDIYITQCINSKDLCDIYYKISCFKHEKYSELRLLVDRSEINTDIWIIQNESYNCNDGCHYS